MQPPPYSAMEPYAMVALREMLRLSEAARDEAEKDAIRLGFDYNKLKLEPVPMLLWCPECGARHIDVGDFSARVHHTHSCQTCGMTWRPAIVPTLGVQFLPGFKNE